jgi:hypothetical protein
MQENKRVAVFVSICRIGCNNVYVLTVEIQALQPRPGCDIFYNPTFTLSPS